MILNKEIPVRERLNFIIYVFSRVMLSIGNHVYLFAVSYFILYETGSSLYFSINLAISIVVSLILLPFSGLLSDLGNKRKIVITGEISFTFILLGLFIYSYFFGINLLAIYITTFLTSLISPFISNAFQAAMTELFHKNRIQKVMGYVSAILSSAVIAGPILGGVLFGLLSFNQIILIYLVLFSISTVLDFALKFNLYFDAENYEEDGIENKNPLAKFKRDITEGMVFIINNKVLKRVFILAAFINLVGATMSILPEMMMITELNFEPELVGYVNAFLGMGMLIGGILIGGGKKMKNPVAVEKQGLLFLAFLIMLYPLPIYLEMGAVFNFIFVGMLGFGLAIGMQLANIPMGIYLQLIVPQKIKGRVFSSLGLVSMSLMPLGTIIYGLLYDIGGYWIINIVSGLSVMILALTLLNKKILSKSEETYGGATAEAEKEEDLDKNITAAPQEV